MSKELTTTRGSVLNTLAAKMAPDLDPDKFAAVVKATCIPSGATNEQFAAFLMTAQQHGLNPITKEIYAFPAKGGGIQPVVGIDGWVKMANSHPQFDGMEFTDSIAQDGSVAAITCIIHRKDRSRPVTATEYMDECRRNTDPWKSHPRRMLRHKATIQAIRLAFGFAGVVDAEEYEVVAASPEVRASLPAPSYDMSNFMRDLREIGAQENEAREIAWEAYGKRLESCTSAGLTAILNVITERMAEAETDISPDEQGDMFTESEAEANA